MDNTPVPLPSRRKRIFRFCAIGSVALLLIGLIVSWTVSGWLISAHQHTVGDPPVDLPATSISLESKSGATIKGWHIQAPQSKGVLILLHPIRGSRLSMLDRARLFHSSGYSIVMVDLQAHGESRGEHITIGHLEKHDARAAVEFARSQHPDERIGVVGMSLGGASALLASPLGIDAMVLESVYPNIEDAVHNRVAAQLGLLSTIPAEILLAQLQPRVGISTSQLRPIDHIADVECPLLFISGMCDEHTTPAETERMFEAACEPKELWMVDGAAHVDLYKVSPDEYKKRVVRFLNAHMRIADQSTVGLVERTIVMGRYDGPHFEVENENVVSVWAATVAWDDIPDDYWEYDYDGGDDDPWNRFSADFGFGHYDDDFVESYFDDDNHGIVSIGDLVRPLSYSSSFVDAVVRRAGDMGIERTSYVYLMYNFRYDPAVTGIDKSEFFRFVGAFEYDSE